MFCSLAVFLKQIPAFTNYALGIPSDVDVIKLFLEEI